MRWKQADFIAGSFVILGAALIIAILLVVRGQIGAPDRYHTFFKNVGGLKAGAAVVYEGYIIGSVEDVDPMPDDTGMRFRVNLAIEKDWVIPQDSVAEISAVSLLSANAIQITAGTGAPLSPGDEVKSIKAVNVMTEISRTADELAEIAQSELAPLLATLRDVLATEGRGALASISTLSGALAENTPDIMANLEAATNNMAAITGGQNAESISRTISNVESASAQAVVTVDSAASMTRTVGEVLSQANLQRVDRILMRLDESAQSLDAVMQSVLQTSQKMERTVSDENIALVNEILRDVRVLQDDIDDIVSTGAAASQTALEITALGEDRLEGFLQRMEAAALNIEEMTARLRDNPSLLILGSE